MVSDSLWISKAFSLDIIIHLGESFFLSAQEGIIKRPRDEAKKTWYALLIRSFVANLPEDESSKPLIDQISVIS